MSISILLIIVAVIVLILMWKNAMKAREIAIRMAIRTLKTTQIFILDINYSS